MAKIFLNDNINSLFENVTESSVQLPRWISIVDKAADTEMAYSATSSAMMSTMMQKGGDFSATSYDSSVKQRGGGMYSATSSANMSAINMKGGAMSATSSEQDVNKLISMLTSESSTVDNINGQSETSTVSLENQLRDILSMEGGKKKKKSKQKGGNGELSADEVKRFFTSLKEQGVNVDVKLNNKSMSDFFHMADNTTTELASIKENLSSTSDVPVELVGGKKSSKKGKKGSKKGKKGSKKQEEDESTQDGGDNPGFRAFLDLKKHIATKLGVSNSPKVGKVAGAVQKDMKEKHPGKNAVDIAKLGMEHFDKNMDHYKQMLPK